MRKNISGMVVGTLSLLMTVITVMGQSEGDLREYFEGRRVVILLDMPADEDGINVQADKGRSIDRSEVSKDLKRFGTSIREGAPAEITYIKKKGKHIEFHLNGGGWQGGRRASLRYTPAPKSERHQNVEAELVLLPDPADREIPVNEKKLRLRQILEEDLEEMIVQYEGINAERLAEAREMQARAQENLDRRILQAGSRFNLRFDRSVPREAMTLEGLMHILEKYVDFSQDAVDRAFDRQKRRESEKVGEQEYVAASGNPVFEPASADAILKSLRKGLLWENALSLMGNPSGDNRYDEGSLKVRSATFDRTSLGIIDAKFVEDVLIHYTISSR